MQFNIKRFIPSTIDIVTGKLTTHNDPKKLILIFLLIGVCTLVFVTHLPVLSTRAQLMDGQQYLTNNYVVQNPDITSILRFLTEIVNPSTVQGYYQPLTMISMMFDCALGGSPENFMPFHRTSLILHICNTALIIVLLYMLFGQSWIAAGVGLLFGLHPMTVETIAWVSERKTVLASFFALWSLIIYVQFTRTSNSRIRWSCLVMYILSLMSKPTTMPLPALMLVLDYWPLKRLNKTAILEKIPLFIAGFIFAIIIYISQSKSASVSLPTKYGAGRISLIICYNIIFYLHKIIWPANVSQFYPFSKPMALSNPEILICVIGTFVLLAVLLVSLRWTRAAFVGWLFFFLAIFPAMQIIGFTKVIASDKYAYLPSLGFLLSLMALLVSLWIWIPRKYCLYKNIILILFIAVLAGGCAFGTRRYLRHWKDSISLYEYMLTLTPDEWVLHNDFGSELMKLPDHRIKASQHFRMAMKLNPGDPLPRINLGISLAKEGKTKEALIRFRELARFNFPQAMGELAWILATHPDSTIRNAEESLDIAKEAAYITQYQNSGFLRVLAAAWAENDQFDKAIATANKALILASQRKQKKIVGLITKEIEFYSQGKSYREDPIWPEIKSETNITKE